MPLKYRFALGLLAGAFLGTLAETRRLIQNNDELAHEHTFLMTKYEQALNQWASDREAVFYMLNLLYEHDVELTEFDRIALNTFIPPLLR
jgi:hypothetical protein